MDIQINPLKQLGREGQSVWYDNIHRSMITSGELARMIDEDGLAGVTSNPAIFDKAISTGSTYDEAIRAVLAREPERSARDLFFDLAVDDIASAADQLLPVFRASQGVDGMVSLEVSPDLAFDTEATIREAADLWARLARPNVMIKVPATREGVPAFEELTARGLNVNVTLLFAIERFEDVARAYVRGLERRKAAGAAVEGIASVASFFVSRVDTAADELLAQRGAAHLQGTAAIANAKVAYERYGDIFGPAFEPLQRCGARPQRLLWASTSTKNPAYRDVKYVEALIGQNTVNTLPPATFDAFRDHGQVSPTLASGVAEAQRALEEIRAAGVDLNEVTERLEREGVAAFASAFEHLLETLSAKSSALAA